MYSGHVVELDLPENHIGPAGAKAIAAGLEPGGVLRKCVRLCLRRNELHDAGASALAGALKFNDHLRVVDLSANFVGRDGAMYLSIALAQNKSLVRLNISGNLFGAEGLELLRRGQQTRRTVMSRLQLLAAGQKSNRDTLELVL